MKKKFLFLVVLVLVLALLDLRLGSVWLENRVFFSLLKGGMQGTAEYVIFRDFRIPKLLVAVLTGSGLGLAGLLMQTLFRNPIVGPYVLGLSSGAGLAVATVVMGAGILGIAAGYPGVTVMAAALGSLAVLLIDLRLFRILRTPSALLIAGLMIGAFAGALLQILSFLAPAEQLQRYMFWTMGNLGNTSAAERWILTLIVAGGFALALALTRHLNQLQVGDQYARAMGIPLQRLRKTMILTAGLLTGAITAVSGPVAFVGLVVPHLSRMTFRTQQHRILIPAVFLWGSILMILTDMISQLPGSDWVLPVNSITALIGAPLVIRLLMKKQRM